MRQYKKLPTLMTALAFCALAVLAMSLMFRPFVSTDAQEQKPVEVASDASLAEAERAGIREQLPVTPIENIINTPEGSSCSWVSGTVYPITVLDQATVTQGNTLYSFAGVSTAIVANSYKFDGTTWTAIAPLPVALEYPQAVSDGTFIYILGGSDGAGVSVNTVYRYNPATDTYMTMAPFTTASWNHAAEFLNGKIYKFTGTAGTAGSTNVLEIYDVATNTWTTGAAYPASVSFISSFKKGNFIYAGGGIASVGSLASLKTYRYDPATNTWDDAAIADFPQTRWGAASSRVGYGSTAAWTLAGGYVNGTATANISTSVIEWDSATNAWTTLPSMVGERARMTGAVLGSSFYVIGGRSLASAAFIGTNTTQKLTCVSNIAVPTAGTLTISGESCGTPNNTPDPGETLTVSLPFTNAGDTATTNLSVTLAATGGVVSAVTQTYGAIAPGGAAVSRDFVFTVSPTVPCGGTVTLTFTLTDGATSFGTVTRTYTTGVRTVSLAQNFDGVTAPALPAGWTNVVITGTAVNWVTTTTTPSSPPNAAFAPDPATVNAAALVSPAVTISSADAQLTFRNQYNLETNFDGMVLEYTTNGGTTWTDVITGGGTFVSGGYSGTISTAFMNPIAGRMAWTANSNGYVNSVVNLPAALNGQTVQFRWLVGTDNAVAVATGGGWVDDVQVLGARVCQICNVTPNACNIQRRSDFNGDGTTDFAVFRPVSNIWYVQPNGAGSGFGVAFGAVGDKIQPADYDGDGRTDIGVYRNGMWYWIKSSDNTVQYRAWGTSGDIPVAGDYLGSTTGAAGVQAELAVYRPATGIWYALNTADNTMAAVQWGGDATDIPALGDFDNDCKLDFAVRRTTNSPVMGDTQFFVRQSSNSAAASVRLGRSDMAMAIADYDGDGKSDVGVVASSMGQLRWYVVGLNGAVLFPGTQFGVAGDIVTVGNYDSDVKADLSIFRPSTGLFAYKSTVNGSEPQRVFGTSGDIPTARAAQYPLP